MTSTERTFLLLKFRRVSRSKALSKQQETREKAQNSASFIHCLQDAKYKDSTQPILFFLYYGQSYGHSNLLKEPGEAH